jgi:hypothetical protein
MVLRLRPLALKVGRSNHSAVYHKWRRGKLITDFVMLASDKLLAFINKKLKELI